MKLKLSLFIVSAIGLASCVDIPDYSTTPNIQYNGIKQYTQTDTVSGRPQSVEVVTITIDFQDGDGDLGATDAETNDSTFTQRYSKVPNWGKEANYELVPMMLAEDGKTWIDAPTSSIENFKFFKYLKPDGKTGPIKGKLDYTTRFYYLGSAKPQKRKFKVRIIDRAFNISNQTEPSDEVTVPVF
jgi:hypothetical protein